jgi:hypothetical protein
MNTAIIIIRLVLAWMALVAAQMLAGMLVPVHTPVVPNLLPWWLAADAAIVLAIGSAALRSDWRGWKLAAALFAVPGVVATANMVEGVIFLQELHVDWRGITAQALIGYAIAAILWMLIFRGPVAEAPGGPWAFPERTLGQKILRFLACDFSYVFLYYLAGMIVFPFVREFYMRFGVPPVRVIVPLQLLFRGPLFVLLCLLLLRMFRLPRWSGALAVGLSFTLVSAVAALIIPNPYFPDSIRWAHFCEVTTSNFVFGCVVGWVWGKAQSVRAAGLTPERV